MSKEQIEEMAKVLKGVSPWEEARLGYYESKAEALYNAGYRKQSEGEWITKDYTAYCSACKIGRDIESQFGWTYCPYCGAKMKGGE